jgi:uncharacterized membrane protein YedE/YeeE
MDIMTIDFIQFTPWHSLFGGMLIGLSAALTIHGLGRIAGISGILGGLLKPVASPGFGWRLTFIAGLVAAPLTYSAFSTLPQTRIEAGWAALILAGLLVGFGSRLGSGCTSGHGVCGLSRLSLRSLVATLTFMATGFITTFVMQHLL